MTTTLYFQKNHNTMWCTKCDSDLADCDCPDMPERLDHVLSNQIVIVGEKYLNMLLRRSEEIKRDRKTPKV